nr:PepSY domain-containing protein [Cytophagales bacterium]
MRLRRLIGQIHLWLGLASGLVVFIVSLTGCLYVFEEEIRAATHADFYYVPPQSRPEITVDEA